MRLPNLIRLGALGALLSVFALADHGGDKSSGDKNKDQRDDRGSFESSIVGSTPGATIGGVASGGAPWIVARGQAFVNGNGKLEVEVHGLLLTTGAPANLVGTTGPVQMVAASLVCGGSGGAVAASTDGVPLSGEGNARIEEKITVPATCAAPSVLLRAFNNAAAPGSQLGPFIAVTGFDEPVK